MDLAAPHPTCLFWVSTLLYGGTFLYVFTALKRNDEYNRKFLFIVIGLGFLFHSLGLYFRGVELNALPLTNIFEILVVISWCTVFTLVVIQIAFKIRLLGFFGMGLAFTIGIIALLYYDLDAISDTSIQANPWVEFHAIVAIFSYGLFALLAITSLMYLLQDHALTHKEFSGFYSRLPSLKQLAELSQRLLLLGVIALSLSVLIGTLSWFSNTDTASLLKILNGWFILIAYTVTIILKKNSAITLRQFAWAGLLLFIVAIASLWPLTH